MYHLIKIIKLIKSEIFRIISLIIEISIFLFLITLKNNKKELFQDKLKFNIK